MANYGKKTGQKITENRRADKDAPLSDATGGSRTQPASKSETARQMGDSKTALSKGKEAIKKEGFTPKKHRRLNLMPPRSKQRKQKSGTFPTPERNKRSSRMPPNQG